MASASSQTSPSTRSRRKGGLPSLVAALAAILASLIVHACAESPTGSPLEVESGSSAVSERSPGVDGLEVRFAFDGPVPDGALDTSGGARHAGCAPDACPTLVKGVLGSGAAEFDGVDDGLTVAGSFDPPPRGTVALWLRRDDAGGVRRVVAGGEAFGITIDADGRVTGRVFGIQSDALVAGVTIPPGEWHHVGLTYDLDTGVSRLFVDGALAVTGTAGSPASNALRLSIGGSGEDVAPFAGALDEVRMYDRALAPDEVRRLAAAATLSAEVSAASSLILDPEATIIDEGEGVFLSVEARDGLGSLVPDPQVEWLTSDPAVLAVDPAADGSGARVESLAPGTAYVVASWNGHEAYAVIVGRDLPSSAPYGRLVASPGSPWLTFADGSPHFLCGPGDPEDFLYRGARRSDGTREGDQDALLDALEGTGANGIYFQAIRSHGGDGDASHNPFVDGDPARGLDLDILDQWDGWFARMQELGVLVYFFIYDDEASVWDTGDTVGPEEAQFLRGLVNRFEHHPFLVWVVAEEYQERFSARRVSAIAAEIRAADDVGHPVAVHKLPGLSFEEFADDPSIDQFAIQSGGDASQLHANAVTAWNNASGRYNLNLSEAAAYGTGEVARRKNWAAAMGGAYVMVLGMDIAGTARSDLVDCGRLVSFMESTPLPDLAPHDELVRGGTTWMLADPGEAYVGYAAGAAETMGLADVPAGTYDLRWLDAETGASVTQTGVTVAVSGSVSWPVPAGFTDEIALYVQRTEGPAPRPVASVEVSPASLTILEGRSATLQVTMRDAQGDILAGRQVLWRSDAPAVAAVDATGIVTGAFPGTARITATSEGVSDGATVTVESPAPPPVVWYSFDRNLGGIYPDLSGNRRHLLCGGSACPTRVTTPDGGGAVYFDGANDILTSLSLFDPPDRGTVTFFFWRHDGEGTRMRILGGHDAFEVVVEPDDRLTNQLFAGGDGILRGGSVASRRVYHAALTWDRVTGEQEIFLDGTRTASGVEADDDPGVLLLSVGGRAGMGERFRGYLDDVRIYDRVLIPAQLAEIIQEY